MRRRVRKCVCKNLQFTVRIFHICSQSPTPLSSRHTHVPVACLTVFTTSTTVLNFRHRYANHTGVINRSVTGIMQMTRKEWRATEKARACKSANLPWHSPEGDSFVGKVQILVLTPRRQSRWKGRLYFGRRRALKEFGPVRIMMSLSSQRR